MHNCVQARQARGVGKHDGTELLPVHAAIRREDSASKLTHHIIVGRGAGLNEAVRDFVGIEHVAPEFTKNRGDCGLSGGDSARQAYAQHQGLAATAPGTTIGTACARRRRAPFTVLLISMAIVHRPTPPAPRALSPATSAPPPRTPPSTTDPL